MEEKRGDKGAAGDVKGGRDGWTGLFSKFRPSSTPFKSNTLYFPIRSL